MFRKSDFLDPEKSELFKTLLAHESDEIRKGAHDLLSYLEMKPEEVPPLNFFGVDKGAAIKTVPVLLPEEST